MLDKKFFDTAEIQKSYSCLHQRERARSDYLYPRSRQYSFAEFARHKDRFIEIAFRAIRRGDFCLGSAQPCLVSADKQRTIYKFEWLDHFIIYHFARCVNQLTNKHLPDQLYSYRSGRSNRQAVNVVSNYLKNATSECFVLRRDVKSFGEQMAHQLVSEDLVEYCAPSDKLLQLFESICKFRINNDGQEIQNQVGLPTGHYLQLVCSNLYLIRLDRILSELGNSIYVRFGDDLLFVSQNMTEATSAAGTIDSFMKARMLCLSENKSLNFVLRKCHLHNKKATDLQSDFIDTEYFEYLGHRMSRAGVVDTPSSKKQKMQKIYRSRLQFVAKKMSQNAPTEDRLKSLIRVVKDLTSDAIFRQANTANNYWREYYSECELKEFDRWLATTIVKLATNRGFSSSNFKHVSYAKLRSLGLPSILHLRRKGGL